MPLDLRRPLPALCGALLAVCIFLSGVNAFAATAVAKRAYDIPAANAEAALKTFSQQSGKGVIASTELVRGVTCNAVKGDYTAAEALDQLLIGTGLIGTEDRKSGTFAVRKETALESKNAPSRPADATAAKGAEAGMTRAQLSDGILKLEEFEVVENRVTAFSDANVDIPRTINDPQAYFIFNQRTIEQSGATSLEGFLRERLTMSSAFGSNSQANGAATPFAQKTTSSFSMRGLTGGQQLLVLVNGRRMANLAQQTTDYQPDLNGIPLGAIDRIEVLPSSGSGIYGGGAVSGVINVVLKRHYAGTDVRVSYSNPFDTDAPIRTFDFTTGLTLEGGKTNVLLTASWSNGEVLLLQDREKYLRANLARRAANNPTEPVGITALTTVTATSNLNGLGSPRVTIPAGYRGFALDGLAPLLANAGVLNFDPPATANYFIGLRSRIGSEPEVRSLVATVRREMLPWLEMYAEGSYRENLGTTYYGAGVSIPVAATAPTNPFHQAVSVRVSSPEELLAQSRSLNRTLSVGLTAKLSHRWQAQLERAWSGSLSSAISAGRAFTPFSNAVNSGVIDVFRDPVLYPIDAAAYLEQQYQRGTSSLNESSIRAAGPLWFVPGIEPSVVFNYAHRKEGRDDVRQNFIYPTGVSPNAYNIYPGQTQSADAYYGEMTLPVVTSKNAITGIDLLDLQIAGRTENMTVRNSRPAGAGVSTSAYNALNPPADFLTSQARYSSTNFVFGGRWRPWRDVMFRVTQTTGYVPPTFAQLNPGNPSATLVPVADPKRGGATVPVRVLASGGNPNITPEHSDNWNAGVVFTPRFAPGFRLAVDYTYIVKRNSIASISNQFVVDNEDRLPGRVTRGPVPSGDPYGVGPITGIDVSFVNLNQQIVKAYDFSANYRRNSESYGTFDFTFLATYQPHFQQQTAAGAPLLEYSNTPSGGSVLKWRWNAQATWDYKQWTLGWAAQFYNRYKQLAAPLSPFATNLVLSQGDTTIPSQLYHDVFVRYQYRLRAAGAPRWWDTLLQNSQIQVGVKNVFNEVPPYDANRSGTYYFSSYGDLRLRSYYISLRRTF